jgi:hypothetical protein
MLWLSRIFGHLNGQDLPLTFPIYADGDQDGLMGDHSSLADSLIGGIRNQVIGVTGDEQKPNLTQILNRQPAKREWYALHLTYLD